MSNGSRRCAKWPCDLGHRCRENLIEYLRTGLSGTGLLDLLPEAVRKQLGLKLEMRKRMLPVLVIDHIEEKPAEN